MTIAQKIRIGLYILGFLASIGLWGYIYNKGYFACEQDVIIRTVTKTVTIREKQNEIRDNRPDVKRVADRLLTGSF